MKQILAGLAIAASLYAQDGLPVNISSSSPDVAYQSILYYSGSNVIYACLAKSTQSRASTITVSAASNANPVSFTATAHGIGDFATNGATTTPTVCISGYTGNWTPLNGCFVVTTTSANAFTIAVDSTTFGAVTGTPVFTTVSPLWNKPVWSIWGAVYSAAGLVSRGWATNPGGAGSTNLTGGSTGFNLSCASRTTYGYQ